MHFCPIDTGEHMCYNAGKEQPIRIIRMGLRRMWKPCSDLLPALQSSGQGDLIGIFQL